MRASSARVVGACLSALVFVAGTAVVAKLGAKKSAPAPRPAAAPSASFSHGRDEVDRAVLLLDRLDDARYEATSLDAALAGFRKAHWRAMPPPYDRVSSPWRRALQLVAITTSAAEKTAGGSDAYGGWKPEVRTWNLDEASFDVRESLLVPPPGRVRFSLHVGEKARFETAYAALNLHAGSVAFETAVTPKGGERVVVDTLRIAASEPPAFHDRTIDLGRFAGRDVDLELATRTTFTGDTPPAAMFAAPTLVERGPAPVPWNVLWIVVDTMRPDVLAAWHDETRDARLAKAALAPLDAWLPAMPTVAPNIDALARTGVAFVDATSAATWTRPGTLAMLTGSRSSEVGLDTTPWILPAATIQRFYASDPPILPPIFRRAGVRAEGFVNNFFLTGYARAGVDPGFVAMVDHRDETQDTDRIVASTNAFLEKHAGERFFAFVNFNSPHNPYEPDARHLAQVPPPPLGPTEPALREYLGEIAKDDDGVGRILAKLDALRLRDRTLVIVTADHGETLSRAHDIVVEGLGQKSGSVRFRHANAIFEETTRIPLVMSLPGRIPANVRVTTPVQNTDIAPTILALEGMTAPAKMRAKSLVPWIDGAPPEPDRPIVSEGRAARSIRIGTWRYVERDPIAQKISSPVDGPRTSAEELYDLASDPGERRNVVADHPDIAAKLREKLGEMLATSTASDARESAALAGSRASPKDDVVPARVHLRFAGGGAARRVSLTIELPPEADVPHASIAAKVVNADQDAVRIEGRSLTAALVTLPRALVGLDLDVRPPEAALRWTVLFDDAPLAPDHVYGGPYGLAYPALVPGLVDPDGRVAATSDRIATIDPARDDGMFVTRDPSTDATLPVTTKEEAMDELKRLLQTWGYAK